jgi:DNA-directed RNA polymerase subunit RPC12/RpoP
MTLRGWFAKLFGNKGVGIKNVCRKCGREVLTTKEFEAACQKASFVKDHATGMFKMRVRSGVVFLDGNPAYEQAKFNAIEKRRGYQCIRCGSVYCLDCLYTSAPAHPAGRACPKCGSTFRHLTSKHKVKKPVREKKSKGSRQKGRSARRSVGHCNECVWYAEAMLDGIYGKGICNYGTGQKRPFIMSPGDRIKIAWGKDRGCDNFEGIDLRQK